MSFLTSLNPHIFTFQHSFQKPAISEFGTTSPYSLFVKNSYQPESSIPLFPPANQSVAAIVLGDGSSHSRLYPLTKRRSEAAIPIAGNYRLIDAVVSNCINSDITKIYALTQFNSTSLNSHLSRAYSRARLLDDGFVEVIAAYQSPEDNGWFQGSADAIRRCLWVLEEYSVVEYLVLPGHHLYKMDYQKLIAAHRRNKADITVSVFSRTKDEDDFRFGIFKLDAENKVVEFREKHQINTTLNSISVEKSRKFEDDNNVRSDYYPSMGIYVINRNVMRKLLTQYFPTANDLKTQVIPGAISLGMKIHGYQFDGYWEDMRSIGAYYSANMETIQRKTNKAYNFYERDSPLYTLPRHLPPTLVADAVITDSVIGDGCILNISNGEGGGIEIAIGIGEGSRIRKAIIDKNARIGNNVQIINKDNVEEGNMEAKGYIISGGIIVIVRSAIIPDGTIL
ncbi:hypothetical protein BUALT_Bualt09G0002000 [Buddleja alternifolia]|uniref:Nucleotidyl transferase domain-containing protein n=1 Tax=Buddleja alternifolia TaxID=168488 RepID=A0AAV6X9F4_9LAMI|nr:hypothetical protein BUALT_Bualt09G0002000 [Buddleja alternifolia]